MRLWFAIVLAGMTASYSYANGPMKNGPELQLVVSKDGEHFQYSIAHPEQVQEAWIEVLDRPAVIDTKAIDVQSSGELDWEWNWEPIQAEMDDDQLELGVWDPDGHTLICDGLAISSYPGGEVSKTVAGGRTEFYPWPELDQMEVRVAQGSSALTFDVTGTDLAPGTVFHVFSDKATTCKDSLVKTEIVDLAHARVTLAGECLREPGVLFLSADNEAKSYSNDNVWIHIASRTSPQLNSIQSPVLDEMQRIENLSFVVHGRHFNRNSDVIATYMPAGTTNQLLLDTEFISSTELRATVNVNADDLVEESLGEDHTGVRDSYLLRLWVQGDQEKFELSEPHDIAVKLEPGKRRKTGLIASIDPFPIRLMNAHSPAELKITIHGENFIPANKVVAHYGHMEEHLRTEYVSASTLHAWIPRQHWRKHQLVYRLAVRTAKGMRYSRTAVSTDE